MKTNQKANKAQFVEKNKCETPLTHFSELENLPVQQNPFLEKVLKWTNAK
jgi:hypothetical protein